ncbi:MAG: hypothetical protein Q7W05_00885 [Deltaproteobacteria bacterium]|nr:hypothetical protein [Deltaproteobacteria bacterium]
MKTAQKKISKKSYIVGAPLPDKLPKRALDFMATAVTPKRAFEIAAKVERIAAKNRPTAKVKRVG